MKYIPLFSLLILMSCGTFRSREEHKSEEPDRNVFLATRHNFDKTFSSDGGIAHAPQYSQYLCSGLRFITLPLDIVADILCLPYDLWNYDDDFASSPKNDKLIIKLLEKSTLASEKKEIINTFKEKRFWRSLVKALPPNGGYDSLTLDVVDAICDIGDTDALPYLQKLRSLSTTLASDKFRLEVEVAIKRLKIK